MADRLPGKRRKRLWAGKKGGEKSALVWVHDRPTPCGKYGNTILRENAGFFSQKSEMMQEGFLLFFEVPFERGLFGKAYLGCITA
ncbi:hypothetical protein [Ferruginibacter sp. HRS2-29]|uniref:hypothetical protein n=1 Tax=Ferruginibacter sp. HRS2-29 TaxID=2487334 RepID=UPI0020CFE2E1|nr:hypothetical protein [Ferruginibacter sp. HRS2-29]MCP9752898.1 hypothetical protein [Ferruginibacter sp. HRS2-29]